MSNYTVTRGRGILEKLFSKIRCRVARNLLHNSKKGTILDIGCGVYPYFLLHSGFYARFGIDQVGAESVALKRENINILRADISDLMHLPYEDDFFDAITMLAVFEHIEPDKLPRILAEIQRVLKPDGYFVMTTPAAWSDKILRTMARLKLVSPEEIFDHKDVYTVSKVTRILSKSGFPKQKIRAGYFEFFMNMWFQVQNLSR